MVKTTEARPPRVEPVAVGPEQAGRILGLPRTMIYGLLKDRRLASLKIGRRRLIRVDELRRFAADQERMGGAA
jgi:excisionase family DNA binding protein